MGLGEDYNKFYSSSAEGRSQLTDIRITRWPIDRVSAIVKCVSPGERVLDIGCGDGFLLYQLRERFKELYGTDLSSTRLTQAEDNLKEFQFTSANLDAEDLSEFSDDSFDCVVSSDTIEHVVEVYKATREMHRVLKPGGRLVINTPNVAFLIKRMRLLLGYFPSTSQGNEGLGSDLLFDGGHLHYFTFRSLRLLLEGAGFLVEKEMGYGPYGPIHSIWPSLLSGGVQIVARKPK